MFRDLELGAMRAHVLHHASRAPVYGSWMLEELRRHGYHLSYGTLYPTLHWMEEEGSATSCKASSTAWSSRRRRDRGYPGAWSRDRAATSTGSSIADEQAEKLAEQPKGTNYDLVADGYTHVVTLLCSTVPEFVGTDGPDFFARDDLPRVATPPELRGFLSEVTEEDLKTLPFARRISGG